MKKPAFSLVIIILFVSFFFASCKIESYNEKKPIIIKGSDTMVNLTQKWAEVYMNKNPNVSIQVTGGGSGNGIVSLFNGTATIANISRELKDKEIQKAIEYNVSPYKIKAALDGIAIIIHPSNKIDSLTIENIRDIYTGRITNWQEIGGRNSKIILYGRENSSGTYEYFKETVLGKDEQGKPFDFISRTQVLQGTASLAEAVSKDKNGIGYGGVGYFALRNDLKILAVKKSKEEKELVIAQKEQLLRQETHAVNLLQAQRLKLQTELQLVQNEKAILLAETAEEQQEKLQQKRRLMRKEEQIIFLM